MNKGLFLITFCIQCFVICAQQHDVNWIWGIQSEGRIHINFSETPPKIGLVQTDLSLGSGTVCNQSDTAGNLQFYSNGCDIYDYTHNLMSNGADISSILGSYCEGADGSLPFYQGYLSIVDPRSRTRYYLFTLNLEPIFEPSLGYNVARPTLLSMNVIDMSLNQGLGEVIEKNVEIFRDTLVLGSMVACRHANSNDWWLIVPKFKSNCFFKFLITSDGVHGPVLSCSGPKWDWSFGGLLKVSPDCRLIARTDVNAGTFLYEYDNCTGGMSYLSHKPIAPRDTGSNGILCEFSSDSKNLYIASPNSIWQWACRNLDTVKNYELVAVWDSINNASGTRFSYMQLAPNGKIYISGAGNSTVLHTIEEPNVIGVRCNVAQNSVFLPTLNFRRLPYFPKDDTLSSSRECDSIISSIVYSAKSPLNISVSPNPFTSKFDLECMNCVFDEECEIQLISHLGVTINDLKFIGKSDRIITIETHDLESGLYFLKVNTPIGFARTVVLIRASD